MSGTPGDQLASGFIEYLTADEDKRTDTSVTAVILDESLRTALAWIPTTSEEFAPRSRHRFNLHILRPTIRAQLMAGSLRINSFFLSQDPFRSDTWTYGWRLQLEWLGNPGTPPTTFSAPMTTPAHWNSAIRTESHMDVRDYPFGPRPGSLFNPLGWPGTQNPAAFHEPFFF